MSGGGAFLRYNVYRLALLVGVGALTYLAGLRGPLLLLVALVVSGVLSYFLLYRQRTAVARSLAGSIEARRGRWGRRTAREDAAADALIECDAADPLAARRAAGG